MGRIDWGSWFYGMFAAFIAGGSGAFGGGVAGAYLAPEHFNFAHPGQLVELIAATFVLSGLPGFFLYLHQNPLPTRETTTTVTSVQQAPNAPVVIKTVETKETRETT